MDRTILHCDCNSFLRARAKRLLDPVAAPTGPDRGLR